MQNIRGVPNGTPFILNNQTKAMFTDIHRFTELDRNVLKGRDQYSMYFKYMRSVFGRVLDAYPVDIEGNKDEAALLRYFLQRLINSIECLRMKYLFDSEQKMRIDQSDSSFPHNIELMYLRNDAGIRDTKLEKLPARITLLKELVDSIYVRKDRINEIQYKIALRTYYENLNEPSKLYFGFTPGELTRLSEKAINGRIGYQYTWGRFDTALNIPVFYKLYFETDSEDAFDINSPDEFRSKIENATSVHGSLVDAAILIDSSCETIYPKELKRLIVGPLFGKYSLDQEPLSICLRRLDDPEAFALLVQCETVKSGGEKKGKLLSNKFFYQQFSASRLSKDTLARKVSECSEILFTPHHIGQKLLGAPEVADKIRKYKIISLKKQP